MVGCRNLKSGGMGNQHAGVAYASRRWPISEGFRAWIRNVVRQLEVCESARGGSTRVEFPSFKRTFAGFADEKFQALQSFAHMMNDDDHAIVEGA